MNEIRSTPDYRPCRSLATASRRASHRRPRSPDAGMAFVRAGYWIVDTTPHHAGILLPSPLQTARQVPIAAAAELPSAVRAAGGRNGRQRAQRAPSHRSSGLVRSGRATAHLMAWTSPLPPSFAPEQVPHVHSSTPSFFLLQASSPTIWSYAYQFRVIFTF
jgi:hypothetical protein